MDINKVVYGDQTLIDLTNDTVTPQTLATGVTAHDRSGALISGSYTGLPSGGTTGQVLAKSSDDDYEVAWDTIAVPSKVSDLTNDSGFITGMTILSYGSSTWDDFLTAYNANKVVYCRASSNSNPATGNQTRMAFMAYVNATPPTSVEFQYYRSVNTHTATQQGDQVYIYKLDKTAGWSVTVRENYTKIVPGTGLSSAYNSGVLTLSNSNPLPSVSSSDNDKVLKVVSGAWAAATDSGGNIMIANITYNGETYASDKTYAQLKAVLDAGGTVYAKRNTGIYQLSSYTQSGIAFYSISVFEQQVFKIYVLISNSDVVTVSSDGTYEIPYEIISNLTTPQPFFYVYEDFSQFGHTYMIYGRDSYEEEITFQELFTGVFVHDYGEWQRRREILPVLCFKVSEINDTDNEYADDGNYETYYLEKIYTTHEWDSNNYENVYTYYAVFGCFVTVNGQEKHKRFTLSGLADDTIVNNYNGTIYSETIGGLPSVTSSDNGKFLCVDNGIWAAVTVPNANGVSF